MEKFKQKIDSTVNQPERNIEDKNIIEKPDSIENIFSDEIKTIEQKKDEETKGIGIISNEISTLTIKEKITHILKSKRRETAFGIEGVRRNNKI